MLNKFTNEKTVLKRETLFESDNIISGTINTASCTEQN